MDTIIANNIAPETIFAGGPVTALLFDNSRLWTVVRTARIKLRRFPDDDIAQVLALNGRLADAVLGQQTATPADELPRFIISRTQAKIVRQPSNVATVAIGAAQITLPITTPPVLPHDHAAKPDGRQLTDDLGLDIDNGRAKRLRPDEENATAAPERAPGMHMVVRVTNGYHRIRKDEFGDNTADPETPLCHYRGCTRELSAASLRDRTSRPVYALRAWQSFFCSDHLSIMEQLAARNGATFCHCCGITTAASIEMRPSPAHPLAIPLCDKCIRKEYVIRQLRMLCRRRRGRGARAKMAAACTKTSSDSDSDSDSEFLPAADTKRKSKPSRR